MTKQELDQLLDKSEPMIYQWENTFAACNGTRERVSQTLDNIKAESLNPEDVRIEVQFVSRLACAHMFGNIPLSRVIAQGLYLYPTGMSTEHVYGPKLSMRDSSNRNIFLRKLSMEPLMDVVFNDVNFMKRLNDEHCVLWDADYIKIANHPNFVGKTHSQLLPVLRNAGIVDQIKGTDVYPMYTDIERLFLRARNDVFAARLYGDGVSSNTTIACKFKEIQEAVDAWTILSDLDTGMDMAVYIGRPDRLYKYRYDLINIIHHVTVTKSYDNRFEQLGSQEKIRYGFDCLTLDDGYIEWFIPARYVTVRPALVLSVNRAGKPWVRDLNMDAASKVVTNWRDNYIDMIYGLILGLDTESIQAMKSRAIW